MNPYEQCPTFETEHFHLRQVQLKDAADLVECYKNPTLAVQGSAHGCLVGPGYYGSQTKREMRKFIRFWRMEYRKKHWYVRWSVIDRQSGVAVGTVEAGAFDIPAVGTGVGMIIDLAAPYETEADLAELLRLSIDEFYTLFNADVFVIYGMPGADVRLNALADAGFIPVDWDDPDAENHYCRRRQHGAEGVIAQ